MGNIIFRSVVAGAAVALFSSGGLRAQAPAPRAWQAQDSTSGTGGRWRGGMGGLPGGARGVLGTVTDVAADHYTIKTDAGETYTVHFSANTRIVKQGAGQSSGRRQSVNAAGPGGDEPRPTPQTIKSTEIKVGDIITAGGEVDTPNKSIGAIFIAQVDPERAKQMREMQANFGKTWLGGRITAIDGTKITVEGMLDHAPHVIAVDENTSFRQRRDSITLADIKPGEQLRADGAVQDGVFLATQINAIEPSNRDQAPQSGAEGAQPKPQ